MNNNDEREVSNMATYLAKVESSDPAKAPEQEEYPSGETLDEMEQEMTMKELFSQLPRKVKRKMMKGNSFSDQFKRAMNTKK